MGGLKSGAVSFAIDQLPGESEKLKDGLFIRDYYWLVSFGKFMAALLPMVGEKMHFFGQSNSFPAVFALMAVVVLFTCKLLVANYQSYVIRIGDNPCKSRSVTIVCIIIIEQLLELYF